MFWKVDLFPLTGIPHWWKLIKKTSKYKNKKVNNTIKTVPLLQGG